MVELIIIVVTTGMISMIIGIAVSLHKSMMIRLIILWLFLL